MVNDFLFELGVEELPSGAVFPLAEALTAHLLASLAKAQISYAKVKTFAAPRRLAVLIANLQEELEPQRQLRRGPAVAAAWNADGLPTPALTGFAKSCGVAVDELTVSKTDKGEWLVHESVTTGIKTRELMPDLINQALLSLPIAKPMRWGAGSNGFVRPVHWAVMLFGSSVLPCDILGVSTGRHSFGHRFHAPNPIELDTPNDYESRLEEAFVVADFTKRRDRIVKQVEALARQKQATAVMPDKLLDEVTSIVEWPEALIAGFDSNFLEVPMEALIASMQEHQKCFALQDAGNTLLPFFVTVSNLQSKNPKQVVAGNEKVMRARLSDAAFFFSQDKKNPLSHQIARTANVVFQERLGTLLDKAIRMQALLGHWATPLHLDVKQVSRAAELSKCDLMTGMVGEFPELQGLMGYYYARHDGEAPEVAFALREQYLPRFSGDALPESTLGLALSLADRMDTLTGTFALGKKPAGDKDPFKLRRHALAVARLLMATPEDLKLSQCIDDSVAVYGSALPVAAGGVEELHPFILERLQSWYQAQGISQDIFLAVKARQSDWLYDLDKRVTALADFVVYPEAVSLSAACKRVNNLIQQDVALSHAHVGVDETKFSEQAEKRLFQELMLMEQNVLPLYSSGDYAAIFSCLSGLKQPVDDFFEKVMVMVPDESVKRNRLSLLSRLQALLQGPADISLLQMG